MTAPLTRLGLVFDCTCPDQDHWDQAYQLALDPLSYPEETYRLFNASLRQGLVDALAALPDADRLDVPFAWFGDAYGHGLNDPDEDRHGGDAPPAAGFLGDCPASHLGPRVATCGYMPGLDLWDPLELALGRVLERLGDRHPVLIVGNSPPTLPLDGGSPFYALLGRTTTRRRNADFTRQMEELKRRHRPAAYLFLRHAHSRMHNQMPIQQYMEMEQKVLDALATYLHVLDAPATEDGVKAGISRAITWLTGASRAA